jgi:hypothetical protein
MVATNQERREIKTEKRGKTIEIYGKDELREAESQNKKARKNHRNREKSDHQGRYKYRSGMSKCEKPPMSILVRLPETAFIPTVTSLEVQRQTPRNFL